jgi:hypothetical protein
VQQHFEPAEASLILQIQTSRRNECDFLAWHPEKRGIFTVKSVYTLARGIKM